jgi:hypothetical protein
VLTDLASKQREQAEKILANILAVEKDMAAGLMLTIWI